MRYVFPAVLTWDEGDGVYYVDFPDTEGYFGCYTDGGDLFEALENADDVLSLMLCGAERDGLPIPEPSAIGDIEAPPGAIVTLIRADTEAYAKMLEASKARTAEPRASVGGKAAHPCAPAGTSASCAS